VLKAEAVAVGTEVATQRKQRTAEWGRAANPTQPMATVMDNLADERLLDMESQVMQTLGGGRR